MFNNDYFLFLKKNNVSPNFFISEVYFQLRGLKIKKSNTEIWVEDEKGNNFTPVVNILSNKIMENKPFFVGFEGIETSKFFDYEFIYNSSQFFGNFSGAHWRKFRKNLRKSIEYFSNVETEVKNEIEKSKFKLFEMFLEQNLKNKKFYDFEVFLNFVFSENLKNNRLIFFDKRKNKILCILGWDENWKYVNFRYCFVSPVVRGASEFFRWKFFTEIAKNKDKLVNDGGSLEVETLFSFKKSLNPVRIVKIYSNE